MNNAIHKKRQAERQVKLLCSLGLNWQLLMPHLFKALREVVAIPQMYFGWHDYQMCGRGFYAEWEALMSDADHQLHSQFYEKNRMLEVFLSNAENAKLPVISHGSQMLRVNQRSFQNSDFYNVIYRPQQNHHLWNLRLGYENGMLATLLINRPPGDSDFTHTELQAMSRLIPFLSNAVKHHQSYEYPLSWTEDEPGLLIFDSQGKVHFMDSSAKYLLNHAVERRTIARNNQYFIHHESPLTLLLRKLAGLLEAIRSDKPDAKPAVIQQKNHWGTFEFKGRWLHPNEPGEGQLFAANLQRRIPLPLKIALRLKSAPLSQRELEVISKLAAGENYQHIAKKLSISEYTVISHSRQALRKLNVENRTELLATLLSDSHKL